MSAFYIKRAKYEFAGYSWLIINSINGEIVELAVDYNQAKYKLRYEMPTRSIPSKAWSPGGNMYRRYL